MLGKVSVVKTRNQVNRKKKRQKETIKTLLSFERLRDFGKQSGIRPITEQDKINIREMCLEMSSRALRVLASWERPNGLKISRVATPLGVIGVFFLQFFDFGLKLFHFSHIFERLVGESGWSAVLRNISPKC